MALRTGSTKLLLVALIGAVIAAAAPTWDVLFLQPSAANHTTVDAQSIYNIEWRTNGSASADVNLYLMSGAKADALSVYLKIVGGTPDNGSYAWPIPDNLVDQGYFAMRITPSPNPEKISVTSSQFYLDVLKAENPCYDGDQRCYPPLAPGWHHRLAIVLGCVIGGLVLLCAGGCFCLCRWGRRRRRRNEAAVESFRQSENTALYTKQGGRASTTAGTTLDGGSRWSQDDMALTSVIGATLPNAPAYKR